MCLTSILLDPDEPYLTTWSALVLSEVVGAGKVGRRCSVAVASLCRSANLPFFEWDQQSRSPKSESVIKRDLGSKIMAVSQLFYLYISKSHFFGAKKDNSESPILISPFGLEKGPT